MRGPSATEPSPGANPAGNPAGNSPDATVIVPAAAGARPPAAGARPTAEATVAAPPRVSDTPHSAAADPLSATTASATTASAATASAAADPLSAATASAAPTGQSPTKTARGTDVAGDRVTPVPPTPPTPLAADPARVDATAAVAGTPQPTPLAGQLARPIFTLAAAGPGSHTMTISVTPDALGPVTVRAHVSPEGIRVELFAPTDVGRAAIRTILPDLRRDLAGTGLGATLDLSSQNQPSDRGQNALNAQDGRGGEGARAGDGRERAFAVPAGIVSEAAETSANRPGASTIDVMV